MSLRRSETSLCTVLLLTPNFFAALRTVALFSTIYSPSRMALYSSISFTNFPPKILIYKKFICKSFKRYEKHKPFTYNKINLSILKNTFDKYIYITYNYDGFYQKIRKFIGVIIYATGNGLGAFKLQ